MRRRLAIVALIVLLAYWATLFVATHTPDLRDANLFPYSDKFAHAVAYALLAWLGAMVLRILHWPLNRICVTVFVVCATYGAIDEWLQQYTRRRADPVDWMADVVGTILGLIVFMFTHNAIRNFYLRVTKQQTPET